MGFAEKGARVGRSVGRFLEAYGADKKKKKRKESTLSFLDDLSEIYAIDDGVVNPESLLISTESEDLPPEQEMFEELMGFMSDEEEMSPIGYDPDYDPEKESKLQKARQTLQAYRAIFSQPGDVDPRALGVLKNLNTILNPEEEEDDLEDKLALERFKTEGKLELEREKGDLRSKQSEKLYDLKSDLLQKQHQQKIEIEKKKNEYRIQKMEQAAEDRVRAITLKNEGADILNQVLTGDKDPQAALSQIDRTLRELDSDITTRRQELNEFKDDNPVAASSSAKALTGLERSKRELQGYQRRISSKVGQTPQGKEKADQKAYLQNRLKAAKEKHVTATGENKAKYEKVIRIIEKKLEALE